MCYLTEGESGLCLEMGEMGVYAASSGQNMLQKWREENHLPSGQRGKLFCMGMDWESLSEICFLTVNSRNIL